MAVFRVLLMVVYLESDFSLSETSAGLDGGWLVAGFGLKWK
jgi:hypothetical protein